MANTEPVEKTLDQIINATDELEGFLSKEDVEAYLHLKESNHQRFKDIQNQGVMFDPLKMLSMQFDVLLELLGPAFTADWGMTFEMRMRELLDKVEKELPKMKLLAGTQQVSPEASAAAQSILLAK